MGNVTPAGGQDRPFLTDVQTLRQRARQHMERGAVTESYGADRDTVVNGSQCLYRGTLVFSAMDTNPVWTEARDPGRYVTTAWIPEHLLNEGTLHVTESVTDAPRVDAPERNATLRTIIRDCPVTELQMFSQLFGGERFFRTAVVHKIEKIGHR